LAFLSMLAAALNQLCVTIGDMQTCIAEAGAPTPRKRLQFTMALAAAARTLSSLVTAIPNSMPELVEQPAAPEPSASPDEVDDVEAEDRAQAATVSDDTNANAGQAEVPARDSISRGEQSSIARQRLADDRNLHQQPRIAEVFGGQPSEAADEVSEEVEAVFHEIEEEENAEDVLATESARPSTAPDQLPAPTADEATQIMQMLPSLFGQNDGPPGASDGPGPLAGLPTEVRACWERWTRPEAFRPVVEQAVQPPLSRAYVSGDTTGSHRAPVLPPPEEFLPLRWERAAGRVEGLQQIPEAPEHLSRAYLSAFMRDLGDYAANNATYASIPEAAERYPHLARLIAFTGRQAGAPA